MSLVKQSKENQEVTTNKKYSKKRSIKSVLSKITNTALFAVLGLIVTPEATNAVKIATQDYKSEEKIVLDANYFNADLKIANYFGNGNSLTKTNFKRLSHNNGEPIYVGVFSSLDEKERGMVEEVTNYYETLFTAINPNYHFEMVTPEKAYLSSLLGKNVIYVKKGNLPADNLGMNYVRPNLFNFDYTRDSIITITDELMYDEQKYYTIMHEFAHSFGLGDTYTAPMKHLDTYIGGSNFSYKVKMLYPNDVGILYSLYGDGYISENGVMNEKLQNALSSFEDYKNSFYERSLQVLKERYLFTTQEGIDEETVSTKNFVFRSLAYNSTTNEYNIFSYQIKILDDKTANFSIFDNERKLLWETQTPYDYHNNQLFFPSMNFEKGEYPSLHGKKINGQEASPESSQYLVIAKFNGMNQFFAPDSFFKISLNVENESIALQGKNKAINQFYTTDMEQAL